MFDSIRAELHHRDSRVHITMVQLPAVNTPQFSWVRSKLPNRSQPVPPIVQPEVAAKAVVWAAHHRRRELFVGCPSDRKSTRLNSSHVATSYAVFCLK